MSDGGGEPDSTARRARPLRWGLRPDRVGLGAALLVAGAVAVAGSSAYVLWLAGLGTIAHIAGWSILPADGWRRVVAAAVSTPMTWLLITGPHYLGVLVVCYLAWMLARHRPLRAWSTALLPAAGAVAAGSLFPDYDGMLAALGLMTGVLVGSAWLAALLARTPALVPAPLPR
jgi:hypothetical protein